MKTKEQNPDKTELHLMSLRKSSKPRWHERRGATKREKDLGGVPASKDVAGTSGSTRILLSVVPWGSGQAGWGGAPHTQVSEAAADPPTVQDLPRPTGGERVSQRGDSSPTKRLGVFQKNEEGTC